MKTSHLSVLACMILLASCAAPETATITNTNTEVTSSASPSPTLSTSPSVASTPLPSPTPTPTPELSPNDLAVKEAKKMWAQSWTQCGDMAVAMWNDNTYFERKGVTFAAEPMDLSEPDSLNGVTWKGRVLITWKAERGYNTSRGSWGDWGKPMEVNRVQVTQKNSKWSVTGNVGFPIGRTVKIKCSQLPAG